MKVSVRPIALKADPQNCKSASILYSQGALGGHVLHLGEDCKTALIQSGVVTSPFPKATLCAFRQ